VTHLTHDQLSAQLDHALTGRAAEEAERHLLECAICRDALAELAAQETELRPALARDPGEEYFDRFAARVAERIRAEGMAGAQGRHHHVGAWWSSPRALAWAGAAAAVIAGAGLILLTGPTVRPPALRDREISGRLDQTPPPAPSPSAGVTPSPSVDQATRAPSPDRATRATRASGERTAEPQREERREFLTGNPRVLARDQGGAKPQSSAEPTAGTSSPAPPAAARTGRATEVRNNAAGEPIPVNPRPLPSATNAPPAAAPSAMPTPAPNEVTDGVRKKVAVQPMQTAKDEEAKPVAGEEAQAKAAAPTRAATAPTTSLLSNAAAEGRLCGEVLDASGRPVTGAVVVMEDVSRTATTDRRGGFCLDAPAGEHPLTVMAVGFAESRQSVEVDGQEASVRVRLAAVPVLQGGPWGTLKQGYTTQGFARGAATTIQPPPDPYAAQPDSVRLDVQVARQLEMSGAARRSAAMYDAAAVRWERTLRAVAGGALEVMTRGRLADARYHAWEISPTPQRATASVDALTSYLARLPAGAGRDEAVRRLNRVRR
jgi:hypothetical protein